jgi:Sulfotransferase family
MSRATSTPQPSRPARRALLNPYFFIVGAPRSGTRLLGRLVNAHPELAVIDEARFVPGWFRHRRGVTSEGAVGPDLVERLTRFERFEKLAVERKELEQLVAGHGEMPYADFVSRLFDLHGKAVGKRLVGDKSPRYVRNLPILNELWPHARLIHLVRDGRDVALSVMSWRKVTERGGLVVNLPTWEQDRISTVALWWERLVRLGREDGAPLGRQVYRQVRYEALVADPPTECESLCAFLNVPYDDAMLHYHETADASSTRQASRPPTRGLRDWRMQMPPEEVERFEAVAGDLLDELGYPRAFSEIGAKARHHAARMRELFSHDARMRDTRLPRCW